jgi:AcrR family transcriptional regulator
MSQRIGKDARKDQILDAAVVVANKIGYVAITRKEIADEANVSQALVSRYFGTMENVKGNMKVICEGLVHKHPAAKKFAAKEKEKVRSHLGLN